MAHGREEAAVSVDDQRHMERLIAERDAEIERLRAEMADWPMLLKRCPDYEFTRFFEDNPEMRYVIEAPHT